MNKQEGVLNRLKDVAAFLNGYGAPSEEETFRKELTQDLLPIISPLCLTEELRWIDPPRGQVAPSRKEIHEKAKDYSETIRAMESTRRDALEVLLDKLKNLKLDSWYTVKNASSLGKAKKRLIPKHGGMGSNPTEAKLIFPDGQKITIKKIVSGYREYCYSVLLEAINTGDLPKLRCCKECKTFFVATRPSKKYCAPTCQKTHDRRAAPLRAKDWRSNQKQN